MARSFFCLLFVAEAVTISTSQSLRIATMNVWSGLTYEGTWTIQTAENDEDPERRFSALIRGLRDAAPDIVALQEVNPAAGQADRIAQALGYDVVTQRVLAGIKVGPVGIPWNLNEGLAILARPELRLEFIDVIPLSSGFGAFGDVLSFHLTEENAALVGSVRTPSGGQILIVNIHLPAYPDDSPETMEAVAALLTEPGTTGNSPFDLSENIRRLNADRQEMIDLLLETLDDRFGGIPLVLLGDFNLGDASSGIMSIESRSGYIHTMQTSGRRLPTWDGAQNPHTKTAAPAASPSRSRGIMSMLEERLDHQERTLDHIFVRAPIGRDRILESARILDTPSDGFFASDHYGVLVTLDVSGLRKKASENVPIIDFLPIASYDTDVGFGYGIKAFFLDHLGMEESFDIIAFNSTKGERWYRLVWSMPDFELRQGTVYPHAVDVTIDYDRYLKSAFFGIGPAAISTDQEEYTKELFEAQVAVSRGLSRQTVAQAGIRYRRIRHSNFLETSAIPRLVPSLSSGTAISFSFQTSFRHDTRNSYINPAHGFVFQGDLEYAPSIGNVSFGQIGSAVQYYTTLMYPKTVLALRLWGQTLIGPDVPLQFLLPLGGNRTLRGYPENRFCGRTTVVSTAELRFPLIWRFGAILGFDTGNVWMSPSDAGLSGWRYNTAAGIRFYMDTFIVRADLGFSDEATGFYLNFGHIF